MVFGLEQGVGGLITPMALPHPLHPIKAVRGISAETCGLDDVFPPDDLGSGPCTPSIIYMPNIIAAFLLIKINSFLKTCLQKDGVAMLVYWMIWYCYCFLSGFKCTFNCIVQYSLYLNMDIGTMWHCTLVSSTPSQSLWLFFCVSCSGVECYQVLLLLFPW